MYYTYILQSKLNGELYRGSTKDLKKRFAEHNAGKVTSTKRYLPWKLIYYEAYQTDKLARLREAKLKHDGNSMRELKKRIFSEKSGAGFTLIEVIMYLALFALLFGGAIAAAYNVIEGSGRNQTRAMMQEEGEFLLSKISYALSGAQTIVQPAIVSPATEGSGSLLQVSKYGGSSVSVGLAGPNLELQNGTDNFVLNNSTVTVNNLTFTHAQGSGDGVNPESVRTSFTLVGRTPQGQSLTLDFSSSTYLRK